MPWFSKLPDLKNNPLYLEPRVSATESQLAEIATSITKFGAKANDPSFDNKTAINNAITYVNSLGGGTVLIPEGVFYSSNGISLLDNVTIKGNNQNSTLKLLSTVTDFYNFITFTNRSNCKIEGLTLDCNFEARTGYDLNSNPEIMLYLANSHNIEIVNNHVIGCGVWVICAQISASVQYSTNVKIKDNVIEWKAGLSTQKPSLPSGVLIDNTTLYLDAIDYLVENNTFITSDGVKNMTCIEPHGAKGTVVKNKILGFRQGLIVTPLSMAPLEALTDNNIRVQDNLIDDAETGIKLMSWKGYSLINSYVNNNEININPVKYGRSVGVGITIESSSSDLTIKIKDLKINNNRIKFKDDARTFTDYFTTLEFYGIGLVSGTLENVDVLNNTVVNSPSLGILVSPKSGWLGSIDGGTVANNTLKDCGKNTNIATAAGNGRGAIKIYSNANFNIKKLIVGVNYIYDTKDTGTYFTDSVYLGNGSGGKIDLTDQIVVTTAKPNLYDKTPFTSSISFDSRVGTITCTQNSFYYLKGDTCKFFFSFTVTDYQVTQGFSTYITLPVAPNADFVGGNLSVYVTVSGTPVVSNLQLTNGSSVAYLKVPSTVTSSVFKVGTKVDGSIEYPIGLMKKYSM